MVAVMAQMFWVERGTFEMTRFLIGDCAASLERPTLSFPPGALVPEDPYS